MMTHPVPLAALDGKVGVLGITGSGKTFTAVGLVEMLLDAGRQVIVIDPTGAYHGLRTEFPLPIFGGLHGDVAIGESDGAAIARLIVDRNLSCIIDVSLLLKESHAAVRRFMAGLVAALKNSQARARYLVMDEADEFMPENANGGEARLFGDLKWIVRRGRKDGWRVLMITQRPQDIAKSVLTQCETLVIHQLTAPQDRRAVEEWVKGNADTAQAKEVLGSLARLGTGEAWIWSPRYELLLRTRLPLNRSADTSRTPDADDEAVALARLEPQDLDELRAALAQPTSQAAEIVNPATAEMLPSPAAVGEIAALREKLVQRDRLVAALIGEVDRYEAAIYEILGIVADRDLDGPVTNAVRSARVEGMRVGGKKISREAALRSVVPDRLPATAGEGGERHVDRSAERAPLEEKDVHPAKGGEGAKRAASAPGTTTGPSPAALAIAELLDRVNPARLTWTQAATMTGRKASGGNFNAARKWLRESGRIVEDGEFIRSSAAAPAGMSRDEAVELWRSVLTNPAPRMIDALASRGPQSPEALADQLGVQPRGGNWNNGLAQLRRNGVAELVAGQWRLASPLPGEAPHG